MADETGAPDERPLEIGHQVFGQDEISC